MKFLLAFGLLQVALALSTVDETQTVPKDVQNHSLVHPKTRSLMMQHVQA